MPVGKSLRLLCEAIADGGTVVMNHDDADTLVDYIVMLRGLLREARPLIGEVGPNFRERSDCHCFGCVGRRIDAALAGGGGE